MNNHEIHNEACGCVPITLRVENAKLREALQVARGTLARLDDPIRNKAHDYGFRQETLRRIDEALAREGEGTPDAMVGRGAALAEAEDKHTAFRALIAGLLDGVNYYRLDVDKDGQPLAARHLALEVTALKRERDTAEAHAKELYEEGLDAARRYKTEIDVAEARVAELEAEREQSRHSRATLKEFSDRVRELEKLIEELPCKCGDYEKPEHNALCPNANARKGGEGKT